MPNSPSLEALEKFHITLLLVCWVLPGSRIPTEPVAAKTSKLIQYAHWFAAQIMFPGHELS